MTDSQAIASHEATVIKTVNTTIERDQVVRQIYDTLQSDHATQFLIKRSANRIHIYHNAGNGIKIPIRTYIVIVLPIAIDLSALNGFYGSVDFDLDDTITHLQSIISKLHSMQGHKVIRGSNNVETFKQLARSLSTPTGEHRTSKTI